jgi:DNA topoisomerase-3
MLILTEKPSVAAAFAGALGCARKDGYFENNDYCIVFAVGHLLAPYEPGDYNPDYKKWSLNDLPIIPEKVKYKIIKETKNQLAVIKKCFAEHKNEPLLLATDAEREGELIGAEILSFAGFTDHKNAKRFWVSEALTKDVVLAGIKNAKPLLDYKSYKEQGYARQQADWLAGMNLTRFISLKSGATLTVGRVQTAVLSAIYERERRIAAFEKEKYFELTAVMKSGMFQMKQIEFAVKLVNPDNKEFPSRFPENSDALKKACAECKEAVSGKLTSLKKEKKTVHPPRLFNLTALQKEAHRLYSYTPEQTLSTAQTLYEKYKCLSYPRTPSVVMGDENVELVRSVYHKLKPLYEQFSKDSIEENINSGNKRLFNSAELEDHHALIPLAALPENAGCAERDIYLLVVERFFTALKPPYVYNAVKITVDIERRLFAGRGAEILQRGWKNPAAGNENDEEQTLTGLREGENYPVLKTTLEEKFTEPQKHYTYAALLQLMENPRNAEGGRLTGLGTPATRGGILKNITDRQYIELRGKNILISEKGKTLIEIIQKSAAIKDFTGIAETTRWEEKLRDNPKEFVEGIKEFVSWAIKNTEIENIKTGGGDNDVGKCPVCGKPVREGKKNYYCAGYKEGCVFVIWKTIAGAAVSQTDASALLAGKKTKTKKCANKAGKSFSASFRLMDGKVILDFV